MARDILKKISIIHKNFPQTNCGGLTSIHCSISDDSVKQLYACDIVIRLDEDFLTNFKRISYEFSDFLSLSVVFERKTYEFSDFLSFSEHSQFITYPDTYIPAVYICSSLCTFSLSQGIQCGCRCPNSLQIFEGLSKS